MMAKSFFRRIADEAKPPVAWGRPECGPLDYAVDVLLDELVKSGSWLDLELKRLLPLGMMFVFFYKPQSLVGHLDLRSGPQAIVIANSNLVQNLLVRSGALRF